MVKSLEIVDLSPQGAVQLCLNRDGDRREVPPVPFKNLWGQAEDPTRARELDWYFRDYLYEPFGPSKDRAAAVEAGLRNLGRLLFEVAFQGNDPEETPITGRTRPVPWELHPVVARKVHFFRKEKSALVQVMIPGYRSIQSGGFSLPGVKVYLDPGDDEEHGDLFLSAKQTATIEALQEAATAMLPTFIAYLKGEGQALQGRLPLPPMAAANGDGSAETITITPVLSDSFFNDEVHDQAEALTKTLTDFQAKILLELRGARDAGEQAPEAHSFKGNRNNAVFALEKKHLLRNGQGRLHLTEDGWNVSEVLRLSAAEA